MKTVSCPRCGRPAPFQPSNRWRPFCSERCKAVDLGDWASERYRVPAEDADPREDPNPGDDEAA
ncbi:MAG TPA: DNA gyrase inhibitor YacG [Burkholderiales bacterium]|nr:DNA gyrase inhibitor YacG [Burkholderiales bacterium]